MGEKERQVKKNREIKERAWLVMSERNNLSNSVDTVLTLPGNKQVDSVLPAASLPVSKEQPIHSKKSM